MLQWFGCSPASPVQIDGPDEIARSDGLVECVVVDIVWSAQIAGSDEQSAGFPDCCQTELSGCSFQFLCQQPLQLRQRFE